MFALLAALFFIVAVTLGAWHADRFDARQSTAITWLAKRSYWISILFFAFAVVMTIRVFQGDRSAAIGAIVMLWLRDAFLILVDGGWISNRRAAR